MGEPVVGVLPPGGYERRRRLFETLGEAADVRFVPRQPGDGRGLSGALVWADEIGAIAPPPPGIPSLAVGGASNRPHRGLNVRLARDEGLDPRLRGWELSEDGADRMTEILPTSEERVLASDADGRALWVAGAGGKAQRAAATPQELGPDELLRDRLRDGRFAALLPILELIRRAAHTDGWISPAPRACFLFDDPNLHWPTYGHLGFDEVAGEARHHGYHVAIATVPLDGWFVHPRARAAFALHRAELSLIIHGNQHLRRELGRVSSIEQGLALAREALVRTAVLERRSGLEVERVMAPPHGVCSKPMAEALLLAGFEALTIGRAERWFEPPPDRHALAGWLPAGFAAGGLAVLGRHPLHTSPAELALLAYLDHPLVLYAHHQDISDGVGTLAAIRNRLSSIEGLAWQSMQGISRGNYAWRRDGGTLRLRLYSRRIEVEVPPEVGRVVVELPGHPDPGQERIICGASEFPAGEPIPISAGRAELRLRHAGELESPAALPGRGRAAPWPILRRGASEARDRSSALFSRGTSRR